MYNMLVMKPKYGLTSDGQFRIDNYNASRPFANFFPGIAGKYGIPMWAFYVNRCQCISSFGVRDKDHPILEFSPANKSWQTASLLGFRTFIKVKSGKKYVFYEPFQDSLNNRRFKLANKMLISSCELNIEEDNASLGIQTKVEYFTIPEDSYAALARIVTIKNTSAGTKSMQIIDGLPQIVPFGTNNFFLKEMSRTIEAWMNVENLDKNTAFYRLTVDPADRPEVVHIKEGNFYLSFTEGKNGPQIIKPIVDPESVFGPITDFSIPAAFLETNRFSYPGNQTITSKTPCGFSLINLTLGKNQEKTFYSVIGYMRDLKTLNSSLKRISSASYINQKRIRNKEIIAALQNDIATQSSSVALDYYAKQTYLDNIMRGGYPAIFKSKDSSAVFYLYSRKHGDLERDYNKFQLQPAYFSQGNGNYRDANQNRRCDIWFNPEIKEANITTFFNLLQTDGFNPLVVKGMRFMLKDAEGLKSSLCGTTTENNIAAITESLKSLFTPGDAVLFLEDNAIKLNISYDEFLNIVIEHSSQHQEAEHGEGFWTDHWHYNIDLLENYLKLYPENLKELVFYKKDFTFFDNAEVVRPRHEKYTLQNNAVRQFHSLAADNLKKELIRKRTSEPHTVRTNRGQGIVYKTTLINKLLCLIVNKLASLDAFGCGIEMESGKPNWYDALNGLPGLLGSSVCETFELKRLIQLTRSLLKVSQIDKIAVTEEICDFLASLGALLKEYRQADSRNKDYIYWDKSSSIKEDYRHKTKCGLTGKELEITTNALNEILSDAAEKIDSGIAKAYDAKKGVYYGYFINEVTGYEITDNGSIKPLKFTQKKLPLFLEAQMHALRLAETEDAARKLYKATRNSELFDKNLNMYKVTASLRTMPGEIGRCTAFAPGWLEHESIWLHMEYKYILELLKKKLYKEFYGDFKNILIPFQDPARYGRSVLENSSFLVSSAFIDKKLHGNGFVARLSGSTVEFIQMWLIMNTGDNPFSLNSEGALTLSFQPALAGWLFDKNGNYSFNFLKDTLIVYHNPKRKDTFASHGASIKKIMFNDENNKPVEITSATIPPPYAGQIRDRRIKRIDIHFA